MASRRGCAADRSRRRSPWRTSGGRSRKPERLSGPTLALPVPVGPKGSMPQRLLIPSTALLWGLQFAFLNPALALLLTTLYSASTTEVGWALALYNASALIATTIIPARADRTGQYLRPMIVSAVLTVVLAAVLALVTSLPLRSEERRVGTEGRAGLAAL